MTCPDCTAAQTQPHHAGLHASCEGCQVRALANGPRFWDAKRVGRMVPSYRKALDSVFGKDWESGHEKVKAEHARLRKLGGLK